MQAASWDYLAADNLTYPLAANSLGTSERREQADSLDTTRR